MPGRYKLHHIWKIKRLKSNKYSGRIIKLSMRSSPYLFIYWIGYTKDNRNPWRVVGAFPPFVSKEKEKEKENPWRVSRVTINLKQLQCIVLPPADGYQ